jgi:hypothetical protein
MRPNTRKDVEALEVILLAIKRIEKRADPLSTKDSMDLDTLYTALKAQCHEVVEIQKLESLDMKRAN